MEGAPAIVSPTLPKYSDGEIARHVYNELRTGRQFMAARERVREQGAAARAKEIRDAGNPTTAIGKHIGCIPQEEFYALATDPRFGMDAFADKGFVRDIFKRHPHLKTSNI